MATCEYLVAEVKVRGRKEIWKFDVLTSCRILIHGATLQPPITNHISTPGRVADPGPPLVPEGSCGWYPIYFWVFGVGCPQDSRCGKLDAVFCGVHVRDGQGTLFVFHATNCNRVALSILGCIHLCDR